MNFSEPQQRDVETLTLAQAGVYTLLVEGFVGDQSLGNNYTFTVYPVTYATQRLTLGNLTSGSIGTPGEGDRYSFTLAASAHLYFDSLTNDNQLTWTLAGPAGTPVANRELNASDGSTQALRCSTCRPGTTR